MTILFLALFCITFWLVLGIISYLAIRRSGGEIPVDNERDIDHRYFGKMLRNLLRPALTPEWGQSYDDNWRIGKILMHRNEETVGLYSGDLTLGSIPFSPAAIIVTGSLTITDGTEVDYDIWCLGTVEIGDKCKIRTVAGDISVTLGFGTTVKRWVDANTVLYLGPEVKVTATASAGKEIVLCQGFGGGKIAAPIMKSGPVSFEEPFGETSAQVAAASSATHNKDIITNIENWLGLRSSMKMETDLAKEFTIDSDWIHRESMYCSGEQWIGPHCFIPFDLICRADIHLGPGSVIAGNVHSDGLLHMSQNSYILGNAVCRHLTMETGSVIAGSVHVAGDALLHPGTTVGLSPTSGGFAATGSVQLHENASLTQGITVGGAISVSDNVSG